MSADQAADGSWHQSEIETISRLFGLHLTVRETSPQIEAALKWLMDKIDLESAGRQHGIESYPSTENLGGLAFICSRPDMFLIVATLFLASIFERDKDPSVLAIYCWLSLEGVRNKGLWFDRPCSHNILRAMVVHPVYCEDPATVRAVDSLANLQSASGEWKDGLPFFCAQILTLLSQPCSLNCTIIMLTALSRMISI